MLLATAACAPSEERTPAPGAPGEDAGPRRILTLAPNLTEIAFAVGLGPRVVGVSDYTSFPPEAAELPHLGGLIDPNLEGMVALEPDLAILLPSQADVAARLETLGVETLTVGIEEIADLERAVAAIAARCGVEAAGRELTARLARELLRRPLPDPPRGVVVVLDRAPGRTESLLVAGPGTFVHELVTHLGATNAFADAPTRYPQVGMEEVLSRAPEAILELRPEPLDDAARRELLADWSRYPELPAVASGRVELIAGDWTLILGPRLPRLYRAIEAALATGAEAGGGEAAAEEAGKGTPAPGAG